MEAVIPACVMNKVRNVFSEKQAVYRAILLLALLGLAGCTTPGMKQLKAACEKDAGQTIYETVSADGYYDDYTNCSSCWIRLIYSDYQYREFQRRETDRGLYVLPDVGYWRVEKVKKDSGQCNEDIERDMDQLIGDKIVKKFREEHCIATRKLPDLESRYMYFRESIPSILDNKERSKMYRIRNRVEDRKTKALLAERVRYLLFPTPMHSMSYGKSLECKHLGVAPDLEPNSSPLVERVVIPEKAVSKTRK